VHGAAIVSRIPGVVRAVRSATAWRLSSARASTASSLAERSTALPVATAGAPSISFGTTISVAGPSCSARASPPSAFAARAIGSFSGVLRVFVGRRAFF
jgi:hypothetical protein